MKTNQNIQFTKGDDHEAEYTITDDAGDPKSLTDATSVKWQALSAGTAIISKDLTDGLELINVDDTNDGVRVIFDPGDTEDLESGSYKCELEAVRASKRVTLAQGNLILDEEYIENE